MFLSCYSWWERLSSRSSHKYQWLVMCHRNWYSGSSAMKWWNESTHQQWSLLTCVPKQRMALLGKLTWNNEVGSRHSLVLDALGVLLRMWFCGINNGYIKRTIKEGEKCGPSGWKDPGPKRPGSHCNVWMGQCAGFFSSVFHGLITSGSHRTGDLTGSL